MDSVATFWLRRQCEAIPGATRAILLLGTPGPGQDRIRATWPEGGPAPGDLVSAANAALTRRRALAYESAPSARDPVGHCRVAVPVSVAEDIAGAVALELEGTKAVEAGLSIDLLRGGARWLESLFELERSKASIVSALDLLTVGLEHEGLHGAATALATELAGRFAADRVSIGVVRRGEASVEAISHSAVFDPRAQQVRDLAAIMDEACDQDAVIVFPPLDDGPTRITRQHQRFAAAHGAESLCTVPFAADGKIVGAVVFERSKAGWVDLEDAALCEDMVALLGPILELKRVAEGSLRERARELLGSALGPIARAGRPAAKLAAAMVGAVLLLLAIATGSHRVTADSKLEGRVQRAIVAGLDGYVSEAHARPGDLVKQGQVLAQLDQAELRLERQKWVGRRQQLIKQHREALAEHDRAEVNILGARVSQAEAELELVEQNLGRTQLVAPFDAIVVQGDLSQSLGSPVEKGDVLFELAPLDGYRVVLEVDERDVAHVATGMPGRLALSALPGEPLPFTVERVTPVAVAEDGRNYFRVEATLEEPSDSLRPGMNGVAKIEIGRRRLLWIWTHDLVSAIRLRLWTWWP